MDVIIEGQINQEETIKDVMASVAALKSCPTPILRITETTAGSEVQGRILFSQGTYIVGARINTTGETGYAAVRQLMSVTSGNYAILDPGRKPATDLNQSLWIDSTALLAHWPDLPPVDQAAKVVDKKPDRLTELGSAVRPKTGQIDLAPVMAAVAAPKDETPLDMSLPNKMEEEQRPTVAAAAPSRKYDQDRWRTIKFCLQMALVLAVAAFIMLNSDTTYSMTVNGLKAIGVTVPDPSSVFEGMAHGVVENAKKQQASKTVTTVKTEIKTEKTESKTNPKAKHAEAK